MIKQETKIEYLSNVEEVSMHDAWFDIASEDHFWLQWRLEIIKRFNDYLPNKNGRILEIGCGNGVVLNQLSKLGYKVDGCDLNEYALKMIKNHDGRVLLYNIFDKNPDLVGKYDCVILMDVVEHIIDDKLFLKSASEYLVDGGSILINVPAGSYLYGPYDKEVGHVRRYSKKQIDLLLNELGVVDIQSKYWALLLVPFAILRKIIHKFRTKGIIESGMKPPGKLSHKLLKLLMKIELTILSNNVLGASLMSAGRMHKK
jgi:2-polyprenyl-3-methyl-5-hydroxy-6-metoxy-1,4-benzoquinol methylase